MYTWFICPNTKYMTGLFPCPVIWRGLRTLPDFPARRRASTSVNSAGANMFLKLT